MASGAPLPGPVSDSAINSPETGQSDKSSGPGGGGVVTVGIRVSLPPGRRTPAEERCLKIAEGDPTEQAALGAVTRTHLGGIGDKHRNSERHSQLSASPGRVIVPPWKVVLFPFRLPELR